MGSAASTLRLAGSPRVRGDANEPNQRRGHAGKVRPPDSTATSTGTNGGMWILLLLLALIFLAPGILVGSLKWLLILTVILVVASAASYPRGP